MMQHKPLQAVDEEELLDSILYMHLQDIRAGHDNKLKRRILDWHSRQLETKVREALEDLLKQGYIVRIGDITDIPVVNQSTIEMALATLRQQDTAGEKGENNDLSIM